MFTLLGNIHNAFYRLHFISFKPNGHEQAHIYISNLIWTQQWNIWPASCANFFKCLRNIRRIGIDSRNYKKPDLHVPRIDQVFCRINYPIFECEGFLSLTRVFAVKCKQEIPRHVRLKTRRTYVIPRIHNQRLDAVNKYSLTKFHDSPYYKIWTPRKICTPPDQSSHSKYEVSSKGNDVSPMKWGDILFVPA
jgi:hypothetical protein